MDHGYYVYIDEAGDDGIGKPRDIGQPGQSHWLVLSALIVSAENDMHLPAWRDEITARMPRKGNRGVDRSIHFADMNHDQRVWACTVVAGKPVGVVSVLSNKKMLIGHRKEDLFRQKNHLYRYLLRYIMERVTWSCKQRDLREARPCRPAKIIFSRRGGMDYDGFSEYMRHLKALQQKNGSHFPFFWEYLDIEAIEVLEHKKRAGLQLADVAASAFHRAVEPNAFGQYETRYAEVLRSRVIKRRGSCLNAGVKPVPPLIEMVLDDAQRRFFESWGATEAPV
ncbi:DUF3800 domain-containing protein [Tistrella mobilis]|uniref:DUF3800 domain-containing protein n=1 Tax=Tistrella mobilis TaxID=171437 RepID=A0A162KNH5_9PROT|nr:DUF3800 domain-containing protein [Tistrella mobilis]KYO51724.1 hypothetical protein AUP44_07860 [Tistrella mobilis]